MPSEDRCADAVPSASVGAQWRQDRAHAEAVRLASLDSFAVVGTPPEPMFDDLTELAAHVCGTPIALIGFIDARQQWFKSRHGLGALTHLAREDSFCDEVLGRGGVVEIPDLLQDPRFATSPWATDHPRVRFYAGAPLVSADNHPLGTLSVLDVVPRRLSDAQRRCLEVLAAQVMGQLEVRRQAKRLALEVAARLDADAAFVEQQLMLDAVLDHTDVLIYAKDLAGRFVMTNAALERMARMPGGVKGHTDRELFPTDKADNYRRNDLRIVETRERQVFVEDLMHPDGSIHTYRSTKFPLVNEAGMVLGIGGVSTDVTELVAARAAHQEAEQRWRGLVEQLPVAVAVVDASGRATYLNPQAIALFGADCKADGQTEPALDLMLMDIGAQSRGLLAAVLKGGPPLRGRRTTIQQFGGTRVTVEINATRINYLGAAAIQLELRDVTDAAAAEAELERSASTDPLTGLLNRRGWDLQLPALITDARELKGSLVVALIDLDRFKAYNDRNGHHAGDVLLRGFADAVRAVLGGRDVFARWGGEEFILAMPDSTAERAIRILQQVRACVPSGQTCSIGYTPWEAPEALMDAVARADTALYQAKDGGRDQVARLDRVPRMPFLQPRVERLRVDP